MSAAVFKRSRSSRESLLCLHCSAGSGRLWSALTAPLADRFDLITPDLLGYAHNGSWPIGMPVSLAAEAQYLAPWLDARAEGVHLLGHSFGGAVALEMALRWPTRVKSLTLYEPGRFGVLFAHPPTVRAWEEIRVLGRRAGMQVQSAGHGAAAEMFVDYWSGEGAWASMKPQHQEALIQRMPKVKAELDAVFADRTPASAYRSLRMPVRLLSGDRSPVAARCVVERLGALLPKVETVEIAGLGHMAPVTHPDRVREHLPAWLRLEAQALAA
jgi:pimeloyl-ACP methyl ester carboxylesterase